MFSVNQQVLKQKQRLERMIRVNSTCMSLLETFGKNLFGNDGKGDR